jgi:anti-anti-sigma regulatory factor/ligand-binding sensor protein
MPNKLSDLIDIPTLQEILDAFHEVVPIASAIIEPDGNVLTKTGWQDICIAFHRRHPETEARCLKSDAYIAKHLETGEEYVVYECANGLVDAASPIIVDEEHLGSVFVGQFLYESPDVERFRQQASEYNFDEETYLQDLANVPVVPKEKLAPVLHYLGVFTRMLTSIGMQRMRQRELEQERADLHQQIIEAQNAALRELSAPLLPISECVVLMPLIGSIDTYRVQQIMDTLLEGVARYRADVAILDITGVAVVDTQVANALIHAAQAVQLLGAQVVLTGIGPAMAQTLVGLGADLSDVVTRGDLQSGIAYAMRRMGGGGRG